MVSDAELNDYLEKVDAGRLLMAIDACQSGGALGAKDAGRAPMNSKGLAQLAYDKGMYILTAAQSQESALEAVEINGRTINHGLLTYALLEALTDARADRDANKQLWEREWFDYTTEQVPALQREMMRRRHVEIARGLPSNKKRAEIVYLAGDDETARPEDRAVQTPRVFYKRETAANPFVITKP